MLLYKNSRIYNNCPHKRHFGNVCMPTKKSLNYLHNQNTPPKTPIEALEENNFFTDAIFDYFKWSQKQQSTNQHNRRGEKHRVVSHTQYLRWVTLNTLVLKSMQFQKIKLCKQNQE